MGSTIRKMSKAKNQVQDLKKDLNKFSTELINAKNALNAMMKGNGTDAYWQGEAAVQWYSSAIKYINKMMGNYNHSYDEFADYAKMLDKAETKRKFKGQGKLAIKALAANATGSKYTQGCKYKNMDKEKISTSLPSTVSADAVNDDQTRESFRTYISLKNALTNLMNVCEVMKTDWNNIAANTKGSMHNDAKTRNKAMGNRKSEVKSCANQIEEQYLGDILFSR